MVQDIFWSDTTSTIWGRKNPQWPVTTTAWSWLLGRHSTSHNIDHSSIKFFWSIYWSTINHQLRWCSIQANLDFCVALPSHWVEASIDNKVLPSSETRKLIHNPSDPCNVFAFRFLLGYYDLHKNLAQENGQWPKPFWDHILIPLTRDNSLIWMKLILIQC